MNASPHRGIRARAILVPAGILPAVVVVLGCNYHWYPYGTTYQLNNDPLQLVSAVPAIRGPSGEFEPVCMGEQKPTGLILSVNILGNAETSIEGERDGDISMRPGDVVKTLGTLDRVVVAEGESIGPENFSLTIECLERYPDPDIGGEKKCQGLENPGAANQVAPVSFHYRSDLPPDAYGSYGFTRDLSTGYAGVAILIDMSGSMKGFVHKESRKDVNNAIKPQAATSDGFASDPNGQRITVVRDFLNELNRSEKAIVFQFGESVGTTAKVVCYDAQGNTPEATLRERCYTADRDLVLNQHTIGGKVFYPELDKLQNLPETAGRSPLWAAVDDVYEFMKARKDPPIRHLVVLNDGPDTCDATSPDYQPYVGSKPQGACSTVGYEAFRAKVLNDLKDPAVPKVHIHFVQFQAYGYLEQDPRQVEMACLTDGHYQFVNSVKPVPLTSDQLHDALRAAVMRVRYALVGAWRMAVDLPDLQATLRQGSLYSVKGTVTMLGRPKTLTTEDQFLYLRVGGAEPSLPTVDRRGVVRLPCAAAEDCGWFEGSAPECREKACVALDAVCGFQEVADLETCTGGICCNGWCAAGQTSCQK